MSRLDRFLLALVLPSVCFAAIAEVAGWVVLSPRIVPFWGAFSVLVGLVQVYASLVRSGEFAALTAAGASPGRLVAPGALAALALSVATAWVMCARISPALPTERIGFAFAALQPAFFAVLALPIARRRGREPWADALVVLAVYSAITMGLSVFGAVAGWAPGFFWIIVDALLCIACTYGLRYTREPA